MKKDKLNNEQWVYTCPEYQNTIYRINYNRLKHQGIITPIICQSSTKPTLIGFVFTPFIFNLN